MTRISTAERTIHYSQAAIWDVITDNNDFSWRPEILRVEQIDEQTFIEYGKNYQIKFHIIKFEKPLVYAFIMDHKLYQGIWQGELFEISKEQTKMVFTESLTFKNLAIKWLSYLVMPLEKIQENYLDALEAELERRGV